MINNLEQIKKLLVYDSEDDFYHLQIIKRKKEHSELGSNSYIVKTYYITSNEYLDLKFEEIKNLCDFHNARAYINLNRRSFEKLAYHNLKKVTDCIMNRDFKSVRKSYESVCDSYMNEPNKKWIIDIDSKDFDYVLVIANMIKHTVPIIESESKIVTFIETKNGWHIITKPFNVFEFCYSFRTNFKEEPPQIHKNNPTILYIP